MRYRGNNHETQIIGILLAATIDVLLVETIDVLLTETID